MRLFLIATHAALVIGVFAAGSGAAEVPERRPNGEKKWTAGPSPTEAARNRPDAFPFGTKPLAPPPCAYGYQVPEAPMPRIVVGPYLGGDPCTLPPNYPPQQFPAPVWLCP